MTYFLVYNDVHFDAGLSLTLKDSVETVVLMNFAGSPKIQLRREPPILVVESGAWNTSKGRKAVHTRIKITSLALSSNSESAQR